ncbi:glutathione S-transferase family protein [Trinickia fusca]|uniref:Glutathione S-transferase family protein n=1 Tax=Trinickia fusca TaxID=2419777 RepID=A0A494X3I5_9BURK|nr:glutathione S-transferase family protein [Trinickia fusca]RKP45257.1 glutathione S-transferase family protein [Trinickia fusca]
MDLYGDLISSSTRRVLVTADCVNAPIAFKVVDIVKKENRHDAFLQLNPNGTIPAFVDGDIVLFEASAIMTYLAEKYGSELLPKGARRIETLKWTLWAAEHFRQGPNLLLEERYLKKIHGEPENPWAVAHGEMLTRKYAAVLDEHLAHRRFVTGDTVTLADFDLAAPFSHLTRSRAPLDEYPNLVEWHTRLLEQVPAWARRGADLERRIRELN